MSRQQPTLNVAVRRLSRCFYPPAGGPAVFNETKTLHQLHKTFSNFLQFDLEILKWGYLRIYDDDKTRPRFWREKKPNIFSHTISILTYLLGMVDPTSELPRHTAHLSWYALVAEPQLFEHFKRKEGYFETVCSGFAAPSNNPMWTEPINTLERWKGNSLV